LIIGYIALGKEDFKE